MLAVLFLTIGAVNAAVAMTVSTCPNGEADSLSGGLISLVLYFCAVIAASISRPPPWKVAFAVPASVLAIWHTYFAIGFALDYWTQGHSACNAMGLTFLEAGVGMDGRESMFTALWLALSLAFWVAIAVALWRSRRSTKVR